MCLLDHVDHVPPKKVISFVLGAQTSFTGGGNAHILCTVAPQEAQSCLYKLLISLHPPS